MLQRFVFLIAMSLVSFKNVSAQEGGDEKIFRFPAVHDTRITFSYAGDLYTVAKSGGVARKITSDIGYEMFARYSPDGSRIAFTGQFDGNTEVYVIPSQGGVPVRVTYTATLGRDDVSDRMGPNNIVMTWKDNENIIYRSRKQTFNAFKGQLFVASVKGGLSQELPFSVGGFCTYSPDVKKIAMNRIFREFRTWKYYEGGMADDVWIYDVETRQWENISKNVSQDIQPMWSGEKIYYLSDRDRIMNLFVYDLTTRQSRKLTNFTDYDIKFPSLGDKDIVFEKGGLLYLFNLQNEQVTSVPIQIENDQNWSRDELIDASKFIEGIDLSPDGNRLMLVARGDVFTVPATTGITRNLTQSSNAHDRDAVWSPDAKWIAYISDISGEDEIYLRSQNGDGDAKRITTNGDVYKYHLMWSPDSKKIMWSDRKQRLQFIDIDSKNITEIESSNVGEYNFYDWSPDSKWICYVRPEWQTNNRVFLYSLDSKASTPVTDSWYNSYEPTFSKDGKYLILISDRDYSPSFSNVEFQIAYQNMSKLYLVTLSKETSSPFAPENIEVKPEQKPGEEKEEASTKSKSAKSGKEQPAPAAVSDVKIDLDGITNRLIALPVEPAQYRNIQSADGNIYYLRSTAASQDATINLFKLKDKKEETLGNYDMYQISADKKKMVVVKNKKYSIIDLPKGKIQADASVDLSGMKMMVYRKQEYQAIFNESWRQMRDFFYVTNMHGLDWNAIKAKYSPLVPYVNHRADLNYIIGEMIGELSIGHAYVGGGDKPAPERIMTGLLGATVVREGSGYYKVSRILDGANWSKDLRSPLAEVGVNVKPGDYIIAVNGEPTNNMNDIFASLVNTAGKQVELTVNSKASTDGSRKVLIVPIADESALYYYNWVQKNIRYVDSVSNGKVGYLHIPNMGVDGLNEFIKHYYPQLNKKALIVDDRGNGGGFVSSLVAQRLSLDLVYYNMSRNQIGSPDPNALLGPKVLLTNEYSASDGDIISYRFKKYKIGPVIGKRTWGGVVGIRGSLPIIDGGFLNRPEFAPYDSTGWLIEGYGVDPDIEVDQDPALEYAGTDQQLNKGLEVIMELLKTQEKNVPAVPSGPDKSK